jgi:hypothetical protein
MVVRGLKAAFTPAITVVLTCPGSVRILEICERTYAHLTTACEDQHDATQNQADDCHARVYAGAPHGDGGRRPRFGVGLASRSPRETAGPSGFPGATRSLVAPKSTGPADPVSATGASNPTPASCATTAIGNIAWRSGRIDASCRTQDTDERRRGP